MNRVEENQFLPVFSSPSGAVSISEDTATSTVVASMVATDDDRGLYGTITYSITTANIESVFGIQGSTGEITLLAELDFETRPSYQFFVTASNPPSPGGGDIRSSSTLVMITVLDVDDTGPVFDMPNYRLSLLENNMERLSVLDVDCTDVDTANSSQIRYGFRGELKDHGPFQLDSVSGLLSVPRNGLDYETTTSYTFVLACYDNSPLNNSGSAVVDISVDPVNEERPRIVTQPQLLILDESSPVGEVVISTLDTTEPRRLYRAHDSDTEADGNITYTFSIDAEAIQRDFFSIDVNTGEVTISRELDFDSNTSLTVAYQQRRIIGPFITVRLRITICDFFPPITNCPNMLAQLLILPQNEFAPEFSLDEYDVSVSESADFNELVLRVSCTDRDLEFGQLSAIDFVNASRSVLESFTIDHASGEIRVGVGLLDYEETTSYGFHLRCNDTEGLEDLALVVVELLPVNDNEPVFEPPSYAFNVSRTTPANRYAVGRVTATDADVGFGGELFYSVEPNPYFDIDSDGVVLLINSVQNVSEPGRRFQAIVRDGPDDTFNRATAFVAVTFTEGNERPPQFVLGSRAVPISELTPVSTVITTLECVDHEPGLNGIIRYGIRSGNTDNVFSINNVTGDVRVASVLTLPQNVSDEQYLLDVTCQDLGVPTLSSLATILVRVTQDDSSPPVISNGDALFFFVDENSTLNTPIVRIDATDLDTDFLEFRLVNESHPRVFIVDRSTGLLILAAPLDREIVSVYTMTVVVTEQRTIAGPERSDSALVTILVRDVNDNAPTCDQTSLLVTIPDTLEEGDTVLALNCTDLDVGPNGNLTYVLEQDFGGALAVSDAGIIFLNDSLAAIEPNILVFEVTVSDHGLLTRRHASYHVTVRISSTNRHIPSFLNLPMSISIPESLPIQDTVFTVRAEDPDRGSFGQLTYRIVAGPDSGGFNIIPNVGLVLLRSRLDFFEQRVHTLNITVEDSEFVVSSTLVISVLDVNEFPPSCDTSLLTAVLAEDLPPNRVLSPSLNCSDQDRGPNGELTFTITSGNNAGAFSILGSGAVMAVQTLDFEQTQRYALLVTVSDGGDPANMLNVSVNVVVQPVNEFQPTFGASLYTATIPEDSSVGRSVLLVTATDHDLSTHRDGQISYSLGGTNSSLFTISSEGLLQVAGDLDRERQEVYSFTVTASDGGTPTESASIPVTVTLEDLDDNPPMFTERFYRVSHEQGDTPEGMVLTVACTDPDTGTNAGVVYSLNPTDSDSGFFRISSSGVVQVNGMLVISGTYSFGVTCTGPPPANRSDTAVVVITALVNSTINFIPSATYNRTISEDTSPVYDVLTVSALSSTNTSLLYSLLTDTGKFQIESTTGILRLVNTLDYETTSLFILRVQASDGGTPPTVAEALVNILVGNVNDNVPVISTVPPVLNRMEGPTLRTEPLSDLECGDEDHGEFGGVSFRFERGNDQGLFAVSASGTVSLVGDIDYEVTRSFSLEIVCEDGGSPPLSDSVTLSVNVIPVNDNPPVFPQRIFTIGVEESVLVNSCIGSVAALDADSPPHGSIHYSITSGNTDPPTFHIAPSTGELTLVRSLDFEGRFQTYTLAVFADDSGGSQDPGFPVLNDTAVVVVNVLDTNDNSPILSRSAYSGSIEEESGDRATVVLVNPISCMDADSGPNADLSFSITGPVFQIHPTSGIVTAVQNLNFETSQSSYSLTVQCTDNGSPQMSSVATLFVTVTDINEFSPRFTNESGYVFSVLESASVGDEIGRVEAIDEDAGDAGIVSYSFVNASEVPFSISTETGAISLTEALDFETQPQQYVLQAVARDNAGNSNEATVIVNILNVDDHLPVFSSNVYFLSVRENDPRDTLVGSVSCTDGDNVALGLPLSYTISSSPFSIDPTRGEISVAGGLDLENVPRYALRVTCTDAAGNLAFANVTISLLPFNDFTPTFVQLRFEASVLEGASSGTSIHQVRATDDDIVDYFAITYSIVGGDGMGLFSIDPASGILRVSGDIDRELAPGYLLELQALNIIPTGDTSGSPPLSSTASIFVEVLDINDNEPVISPSDPPPVFILESDGPSAFVLQLSCSDIDQGPNGTTSMAITSPGSEERFQLSLDGTLRTTTILRTNQVVTITCRDEGSPPLSSSVDISVTTTSVNDHPPMFGSASYLLRVREDTPIGATVGCINATDQDGPDTPDGIVQYSLLFVGEGPSKFGIMESTGCIFVSIALDFDLAMRFQYTVLAADMGVMALQANASLVIEIVDAVRDPPSFVQGSYTRVIPESAAVGSFIAQLVCTDPDVNDTVLYNITDTTSQFVVDTRSGRVTTLSPLDFETATSHTISVLCTDSFGLRDTAEILVTVLPVNEHSPTFFSLAVEVEENSFVGREVTALVWMDDDTGVDGEVIFSILSGNTDNVFSVTPAGVVLVRGNLDRESLPFYSLNISISDRSLSEPRSNFGQLNVTILDINDNLPQFATDPFMFGPLEGNETVGHFVGVISCTDGDVGSNALTTFHLSPDNVDFTLFAIDSVSGRITVSGDLRTRELDTVTFTVLCIDSGVPQLVGSARVLVRVEEINRHPPQFLNSSYSIHVWEDTEILEETILTVHAEDRDFGINGMVSYSLLDSFNGQFFLDERSGELSLIRPLDFERESSYLLVAVARDGATDSSTRLRATAEVMIQVIGINEHIPACRNAIYVSIINATTEGSIVDLMCTDSDLGPDGEITYTITRGNQDGYFAVEEGNLAVPTAFRPENGREQYMLQVVVEDLGSPSRQVTIDVIVIYSFNNLAAPQFAQVSYNVSVNELTEVGTVVTRLIATDTDPSLQGQVTYTVLGSDSFRIDANSGELFVATPLDWETSPSLTFSVLAEDSDPILPLSDLATVNVRVINNNDNTPECDRNLYTSQIPSNAPPGTTVLSLNCSDLDQDMLSYNILTQTTTYGIEPSTGRVFVTGQLTEPTYLLNVQVSDGAGESIVVFVSIATLFANLERPMFDSPEYIFSISETAPLLTIVGSVQAMDGDSATSDLTYSLLDAGLGEFYVNPSTGDLVLTVPLDFESVQQYSFTVRVEDTGSFDGTNVLFGTAAITVNIDNINDNQPMFSDGGIYGRTVHETTAIGTSILSVFCTDEDLDPFGSPVISSDAFNDIPFSLRQVAQDEAEISVSEPLSGPNPYFVNITCSDGGNQRVESQVFLFVPEPLAPIFSLSVYEWFVSETSGSGTAYTSIQATSNDGSEITYSIADGNGDDIFFIDSSSGVISLVMTLDYETQRRHGLIVRAVDESNRESNVLLLVQVLDANDEVPLTPPSALFNITQNQTPGYPVGSVECIDADANINSTIFNYTFSPASQHFNIDEFGIIRLLTQLDNTPAYVLPVVCFDVRDPTVNSTGIVTIEVEFVNLHRPVFQLPLYAFQAVEDLEVLSLIGDPVLASDSDIGSFSELIYAIEEDQDQFFIESETGRVGLLTSLDREVHFMHTFTVIAVDGGPSAVDSSRMTSSVTVLVAIEDTNDNAPSPGQLSYVQSINTNHTVRSPVLTITCTDPDEGRNGTVLYSLSPPSTLDNFVIQSNGTILLVQEQPNQAVYSFFAVCTDEGSPSLSSSALVTVTVNFLALSAPVFSEDHYNASILENTTVATVVSRVQATPSDASITVVYILAQGNDHDSFFVNSLTGEISVRNPLDAREQQTYILTVRAGNAGSDQLFSFATVTIFVADINDNSPRFESQFYTGTVPEDSPIPSPVVTVLCTDSDVNSEISYSITGGVSDPPAFNITQGGLIAVAGELDYESSIIHSLEVTCSDGGDEPRTAITTVRINVSPVNEFIPQFTRRGYAFSATENDFGAQIGRIEATDTDLGAHGSITYLLQDPGNFSVIFVDPTTGDVLVSNNLDYEFRTVWNLTVIARDGGGLESSVPLNIQVVNVNDVSPVLEPEATVVRVPVESEIGLPVQSYVCTDADGSNTNISIVRGNSLRYFELDANNVLFWTGQASDLLSNSVVSLTLRCVDSNAAEQLDESIIAVSIVVTDATPPVFSESIYSVTIPEDTPLDTVVLTVLAVGENQVNYTLLSLPVEFPFDIHSSEGNISLVGSLNREVEAFYSFFASATDLVTGAIGNSRVEISILDINDNPPVIAPAVQVLTLTESFQVFSVPLIFFTCTDSDTGPNDDISYLITDGNTNDTFRIDGSGQVFLSQPLDFESIANFTLEITCRDNLVSPLTDTATLLVSVTGFNEHDPVFTNSTYFFSVGELAPVGEVVGRVSATDRDAGLDGELVYTILSTPGSFIVDGLSGEVILARALDFEVQPRHRFIVETGDLTEDSFFQRSSTAEIVVQVTQANEHIPTCRNAIYVSIANSTSRGSILDFHCTDEDEGRDGQLVYRILSGNGDGYFAVGNDSLLVPQPFYPSDNRENFMLQVLVMDLGSPARNITIDVVVTYSFDNLAPPQFTQLSYNISVDELTEVGTVVTRLIATDTDPSLQGQVTYTVLGSDSFRIDANSGELFVATPLDWETSPSLTFSVLAEDSDPILPLSDLATVNVRVINNNDNTPECDRNLYTSQIPSNAPPGTTVLSLNCSDLDQNPLRYSILSESTAFGIDTNTGSVFVTGPLRVSTTLLTVRVSGDDNENINVSVTITTLFSNQERPMFTRTAYLFSIPESAPLLTPVGSVQATDLDSDDSELTYSLADPAFSEFYVNPSTGAVVLSVPLDYETLRQYTFIVRVSDTGSYDGSNVLSSFAQVTVSINNTNDNEPLFSNGGIYGSTIHEVTPVGTSVLTVSCSDDDDPPFGLSSIFSTDFGADVPFELVDVARGRAEVRVSSRLEGEATFFMNVTCTDGGGVSANGLIFIFIPEPLAPTFSQAMYEWFVSELATTGTSFPDIQASSDDNSTITYSISDGNEDGIFYIDPATGELSLVLTLDYEDQTQHALIVRAVDGASRQSIVLLLVQVVDANDEVPLTPPSALFNITQNQTPGYPVGSVECIDADANINSTIFNYTFSPASQHFNIDEFGIIRLLTQLDNTPAYVLPVVCFDVRDPTVNSTGIVTIEVEFVNLHRPVFELPLYTFQVVEDLEVLSLIGDPVLATDSDIGSFSELIYAIYEDQDQFFVESETGRIGLLTSLDREAQHLHTLTLVAIDGGPSAVDSSRMTGNTTVMITIQDANDNAPSPGQLSYVQSINTNHTVRSPVLTITCTDPDEGRNGTVLYSLSPPSTLDNFVIQSNGTILLVQEQPNQAVYSFFAVCTDEGSPSLSSSALVTVTVNFLALSAPVFSQDQYTASILENTPVTTSVLRVQATPSDASITVVYSLAQGNDRESFFIDSFTGEISVRNPLDAREQQDYTLTVRAGNSGSNQVFSFATVSIFVSDINDNSPRFESQFYTGTVAESATSQTPVVTVVCEDSDVDAELYYSITGGLTDPPAFNITQGGLIAVAGGLDYESMFGYSLLVTCSDGGTDPRRAITTVRINLSPVNEFAPQFVRNEYSFQATENDFGAQIGRIEATDGDLGAHGSITYLLQDPGNFSVVFVNPTTGDVRVSNNLDYEFRTVWNLTVIARDGGGLESSVPLNIQVVNVNDVSPVLEPEATVHNITVDEEPGTPLQSYSCSDADGFPTTLSIVSGNSEGFFDLMDNVVVWTGRAMNLTTNRVTSFTVRCQDSNATEQFDESIIAVSIVVTDDIPPLFSEALYSVPVLEDTVTGTVVLTVSAMGENSVNYSLLSVPADFPFSISPVEGNITLVSALNREVATLYSFFVAATDLETRASGIAQVEISIIDVNDNPPVITPPTQSVLLPENSQLSSPFAQYACEDRDSGANGEVQYLITSGDALNTFQVNSNGFISLVRPLDFESVTNYTLQITCRDGAQPPLTDVATLFIQVGSVNEFFPMFTNSTYFFSISEYASAGDLVGAVSASDLDEGRDGEITYSVLSGSGEDFFALNLDGTVVMSILPLNASESPSLQLNVRATDGGDLHRDAAVVVSVEDVNEPPRFSGSGNYFVRVSTDNPPNANLLQFTCYDIDIGDNAVVDLEVSNLPAGLDLHLLTTGRNGARDADLVTNSTLPAGSYALTVTCTDGGSPSISSSTSITIRVDIINTPPMFLHDMIFQTVPEDLTPRTLLFTVRATDNETDVVYSITGGTGLGTFQIDSMSGEVRSFLPLDHEVTASYSLIITASDLSPSDQMSMSIRAIINVIDVNDNDPNLSPGIPLVLALMEDANPLLTPSLQTYTCSDVESSETVISISSMDAFMPFRISSGVISLHSSLDYEIMRVHTINVTCVDGEVRAGEGTVRGTSAILTVTVTPVNIHAPLFTSPLLFEIMESAAVGDTVGMLEAVDEDGRGPVTFSSSSNTAVFLVEPSGNITLVMALDYEMTTEYTLTVVASDNDNTRGVVEPRMTSEEITIRVTDENDNQPTCASHVLLAEFQTGTYNNPPLLLVQLNCSDLDDGLNGLLRYSIVEDSLPILPEGSFVVNSTSGGVMFQGTIEVSGSHILEVVVRDLGSPSLQATVRIAIQVETANDTRPRFNRTLFTVNISENRLSPSVILQGSELRGSFINPLGDRVVFDLEPSEENAGAFIINSVSADVTLTDSKLIDYDEGRREYTLIVRARVNGNVEMAIVDVNVLDYNDNPPEFPRSIYNGSVLENQPPGTPVLRVEATDLDSEDNGRIRYSLQNQNLGFRIDPPSGNITTTRRLDRERTDRYTVVVLATDMGVPPQTGSTTVTILVGDLNDRPPLFADPVYLVSINDTIQPGDVVVALKAIDGDEVGDLTFLIEDQEAIGIFVVSSSGVLRLRSGGLPANYSSRYEFTVMVSDGLNEVDRATVVIYVFSLTTTVVLFEENVEGEQYDVRGFLAHNFNLTSNATYNIIGGDPSGEFEIDSNGILSVLDTLDRENTSRYNLMIRVVDDVTSVSVELLVTVNVQDQNDNPPMFTLSMYTFNVSEGVYDQAASIGFVTATDLDQPDTSASNIEYTLLASHEAFVVDSFSGELFVKVGSVLDREMMANLTMLAQARDFGEPSPLHATALLVVVLDDINDNDPEFEPLAVQEYRVLLPSDNVPPNTRLDKITAVLPLGIRTEVPFIAITDPDPSSHVMASLESLEGREVKFGFVNPNATELELVTLAAVSKEDFGTVLQIVLRDQPENQEDNPVIRNITIVGVSEPSLPPTDKLDTVPPPFFETEAGIAVIVVICLLIVVIAGIIFCLLCYIRSRREKDPLKDTLVDLTNYHPSC